MGCNTEIVARLLLIWLCCVQVRYIGVSNETSYGVMRFVQLAEQLGLPKIVSIQNSYSLLVCLCHHTCADLSIFALISRIQCKFKYYGAQEIKKVD